MSKLLSQKKMPWSSSHDHQRQSSQSSAEQKEASLTTILRTPEDRADLTILLADISEAMRQRILDLFDPKLAGSSGDQIALASDQNKTAETAETAKVGGEPVTKSDVLFDVNVDDAEIERRKRQAEKEEDEEEKRRKELASAATMELKDAVLRHFDDWRDSVILRVGEVVNAREEPPDAQETKHKQRPTPSSAGSEHAPASATSSDAAAKPQDEEVTNVLSKLYAPIDTSLAKLPNDKKALIMHSLLLLLLSLEHYSAYSRVMLLHVTTSLHLKIDLLARDETTVSRALLAVAGADAAVEANEMSADAETKQKAKANTTSRKWKVGLASVAGAALIGVTGGLAAPLLAAGIGTVMGGLGLGATAAAGYLGALAGSSVLVGGLFGAYGGRMTGKMMDQYAKEVQDFAFVPIRGIDGNGNGNGSKPDDVKDARRLRVSIGISGWLTDKADVSEPWRVLAPASIEPFALRFELEALLRLGNSLTTMVKSAAWGIAKTEIIKRTVFGALAAGLWPLALLKVARVIDNPFSVARARSEKAGEVLADALVNKAQGERPLTLVGYSLGARVIYSCLTALADRKAFGLVESVVLLGAPAPSTAADWRKMRSVVAGRLVNVYSTNDYILAFLYRTSSVQLGVAGLQEVKGVAGVENVDVSDLVSGHTAYRHLTGTILKKIGFEDVALDEVKKEERELEEEELQDEAVRKRNEATRADGVNEDDVKNMEREVEEKNKKTMMGWASEKFSQGSSAVGRTWSGVTGAGKTRPPQSKHSAYEGT